MKHYLTSSIQKFQTVKLSKFLLGQTVVLLILFFLSLSLGASNLNIKEVWQTLFTENENQMIFDILYYVRIPRSIAAMLCGASLALAGLMFQSALHNALASAGTIGVNSGAGLFVILGALFFPGVFMAKPIFAFLGALLSALMVFLIAKKIEASRSSIIMIGIAVSSMLSAGSDALVTIYPETIFDKTTFFIGGFANIQLSTVLNIFPILVIGFVAAWILSSQMNVLSLGDEVAQSLGVHVQRCRFSLLFFASLLAAGSVCIGGILGFVGLVVPHILRNIVGTDYKKLVPVTILGGAILVLGCDILSRTLFSPYEVPVGILLSLIGAPFFLFLIIQRKRRLSV